MLQLHVLKLIKSQVPYCGRKWRQSEQSCRNTEFARLHNCHKANMKVITQIYMNCRPDLRDEWLTGCEIEDINEVVVSTSSL
jgi:hypothetical protein